MFSKNKQGEWEVKIPPPPPLCIFQGHPLFCFVGLCIVYQCDDFATHMKVKLQCGVHR